jgi:hypothetical protein
MKQTNQMYLNDNNVAALPVQTCPNQIGQPELELHIDSPQENKCINTPLIDHPSTE